MSTGNNIGVEGAKALSQCLPHLPQLTHLDLSRECVCVCVCAYRRVTWFALLCDATLMVCDGV